MSTFKAGLFFEHFEKTQGLPEKNSRHILDKKLKRVESTGDFSQKNSRKIDFYGLIFRGVAGFWSLLLPNWPHFEQILHSFQVKQTIWQKLKGFAKKLKDFTKKLEDFAKKLEDFAKKLNPSESSDSVRLQKVAQKISLEYNTLNVVCIGY